MNKELSWEEQFDKEFPELEKLVMVVGNDINNLADAKHFEAGDYTRNVKNFIRETLASEKKALLAQAIEELTEKIDESKMLEGWERHWKQVKDERYIEWCIECNNAINIDILLTKLKEIEKE